MKSVVVLSGGLDSTTILYGEKRIAEEVFAISFNYGQRHKKELDMAKATCEKLGVSHKIIDLSCIKELVSNSCLTSDIEVPEGNYADENMKSTVVPNRNMIMASIAIAYAINIGADEVVLGVHSGDHAIYPDCRPEFIEALQKVAEVCDYKKIIVRAPFLYNDKGQIIEKGLEWVVDYSLTWTCYKGLDKPCGKCGSCRERAEAFENNGVIDPLLCD